MEHLEKLKTSFGAKPHGGLPEEALYLCDTVKPLMAKLRSTVDAAESLMEQGVCLGGSKGWMVVVRGPANMDDWGVPLFYGKPQMEPMIF